MEYEKPKMKVVVLEIKDVITASQNGPGDDFDFGSY